MPLRFNHGFAAVTFFSVVLASQEDVYVRRANHGRQPHLISTNEDLGLVDTSPVRRQTRTNVGMSSQARGTKESRIDFLKVAVVYHGHHYSIGVKACIDGGTRCEDDPDYLRFADAVWGNWSYALKDVDGDGLLEGGRGTRDFRVTFSSHIDKIFGVLQKQGVKYDVFFHTWPSPIQDLYVAQLKPKAHVIANTSSRIDDHIFSPISSKLESLKLVNPAEYDGIIWTRPDIKMRYPLDHFSIDTSKINLPNREHSCRTGDHILVFPTKYLSAYLNGSIDTTHDPLKHNPWITDTVDEHGCPLLGEHFNLMSNEGGSSGGIVPTSELVRKVLTDEKGPYYHFLEGKPSPKPYA